MTRTPAALLLLSLLAACGDKPGGGGGDGDDTAAEAVDLDGDGVPEDEDCDDSDGRAHPGADEVCDGVDNDCDGSVDEDDAVDAPTWYADGDGDGFGDAAVSTVSCAAPSGTVAGAGDCDDADPAYHPGADESDCTDPSDYDCDGTVAWADADGDGWAACEDCDDDEAAVNPDAGEVCNGLDDDCDGDVDDADSSVDLGTATTWYADGDGDGYGDAAVSTPSCGAPTGMVADATDCDDSDAAVNPGATEVCDAADTDEDCSGAADDADSGVDLSTGTRVYADADGDGYGDAADGGSLVCDASTGTSTDATDCDDSDAAVNPGATEVCDAADTDEDCSGAADDADSGVDLSTGTVFYADGDGDGYGADTDSGTLYCDQPSGASADDSDCDDTDAAVHPGATETPQDGVDDDCDGEDAPFAVTDLAAGDLVITEIMQNPYAVLDASGEWFEVFNNSGGEVDLDGLYVYDLTSTGAVQSSFTVGGALRVDDGSFVVFGNEGDTTLNGGAPVDYVFPSSTALGNGSDELYLAESSSLATIIDSVEWDDGATFPDPNGASMSLDPALFSATDNDDGGSWCEASSTFGSGDLGTPGADNDACTTASADYGPGASASGSYGTHGANYLIGQPLTLASTLTLTGFGIDVYSGAGDIWFALYTDSGGVPGTLVASTSSASVSAGVSEVALSGGAVALSAGTYWLLKDHAATMYITESSSVAATTWYRSHAWSSTPPSTAGSGSTYTDTTFAIWLRGY